jgi:drug/metabolite transporter (DMT)-like permease
VVEGAVERSSEISGIIGMHDTSRTNRVAVAGLLAGALVWGLIWYPYRALEAMGLSGVTASIATYAVALAGALLAFPRMLRGVRWEWTLLWLSLAAGGCNLGYVVATVHGEVMRVLLLFYLSPLWTVLLARLLLDERVDRAGAGVIGLSVAGAAVMLWHPQIGAPWPKNGAEWVGMAAGFCFAVTNVLVRRTPHLPLEIKCSAVFLGVTLVGMAVLPLTDGSPFAHPPAMEAWVLVGLVGLVLLSINLAVQFGLTHTSANRAIVIFLSELVVAALSSWLLAGEAMGAKEWTGGAMIVAASLFSGRLADGH